MELIEQARAALAQVHPMLPALALIVALWAPQAAIRRWLPSLWALPASWGPQAAGLRQLWQSLPSIVGGALMGAMSSGADTWAAAWGALVGALAPVMHHVLKASAMPYDGELGGKK
jgi:hypothetical protein